MCLDSSATVPVTRAGPRGRDRTVTVVLRPDRAVCQEDRTGSAEGSGCLGAHIRRGSTRLHSRARRGRPRIHGGPTSSTGNDPSASSTVEAPPILVDHRWCCTRHLRLPGHLGCHRRFVAAQVGHRGCQPERLRTDANSFVGGNTRATLHDDTVSHDDESHSHATASADDERCAGTTTCSSHDTRLHRSQIRSAATRCCWKSSLPTAEHMGYRGYRCGD